jgi:hypothetical protein
MPARLVIKKMSVTTGVPGAFLTGQVVDVVEPGVPLGGADPTFGKMVTFTVTNRTVAEMNQYLNIYNRAIDMIVTQGPDPSGFRRINVRNNNCNVSGTVGEWTVEAADKIANEWNGRYPSCGLVTVGFPQPDTWTCEGTFTSGQAVEFEQVVIEFGLSVMDVRRIWYVIPTGVNNIIAAGGTQTGTFAQISPMLRDARLD